MPLGKTDSEQTNGRTPGGHNAFESAIEQMAAGRFEDDGGPTPPVNGADGSDDTSQHGSEQSGLTPADDAQVDADAKAKPDADSSLESKDDGENDQKDGKEKSAKEKIVHEFEPDEEGYIFNNGVSKYTTAEQLVEAHDVVLRNYQQKQSELNETVKRLEDSEAQRKRYEENFSDEDLKNSVVSRLALQELEGLVGKERADRIMELDETQLEDDLEAQRMLDRASDRAEQKYASEMEARAKKADDETKARKERAEHIASHLGDYAKKAFSDDIFKNLEAQELLGNYLSEESDGYTRLEKAARIGMTFGDEFAEMIVDGMRFRQLQKLKAHTSGIVKDQKTKPKVADDASPPKKNPKPERQSGREDIEGYFSEAAANKSF